MKYIKKYNEELNVKKALLGTALAAGLMASSCKKDDITPNIPTDQTKEITKDSTDVKELEDSSTKTLDRVSDIVNKIANIGPKKPEVKKESKPKKNKVYKFKDFLKSKFKKGK